MTERNPWEWPEETWRGIVGKVRAGRSLKPKTWPGGARCAVGISFDSDHETLTLRTGNRSPGKLSQGQYGNRVAMPRILRILDEERIPATFFVPAVTAQLYPDEQKAVVGAGHEIGIHSWIHEYNSTLAPEVERDLQLRAGEVLEKVTGVKPVGIRTPSWDFSETTLSITREMGLLYDSSLMADDDPYELVEDGEATGIVELPVEWIRDDAPYWMMDFQRGLMPHSAPAMVEAIWKAEFDMAWEEGGLFLHVMHPHITGHRSRIPALTGLIRHIKEKGDIWFATHEQIARYCLSQAGG